MGIDAIAWAMRCESLGAGELSVNSIDADGTKDGYELKLTRSISDAVRIPVIASGGAGSPRHMVDAVTEVFRVVGPLRPTPPVGGDRDTRGIIGVTTHNEGMVFVLDENRFVEMALALAASGALPEGA